MFTPREWVLNTSNVLSPIYTTHAGLPTTYTVDDVCLTLLKGFPEEVGICYRRASHSCHIDMPCGQYVFGLARMDDSTSMENRNRYRSADPGDPGYHVTGSIVHDSVMINQTPLDELVTSSNV
jgi:hypothetical protein